MPDPGRGVRSGSGSYGCCLQGGSAQAGLGVGRAPIFPCLVLADSSPHCPGLSSQILMNDWSTPTPRQSSGYSWLEKAHSPGDTCMSLASRGQQSKQLFITYAVAKCYSTVSTSWQLTQSLPFNIKKHCFHQSAESRNFLFWFQTPRKLLWQNIFYVFQTQEK